MSYATEQTVIAQRLVDNWSATDIAHPNVTYTPNGDAFIRWSVQGADSFQAGLAPTGSRRFRHEGLLAIRVFVPVNTGFGTANSHADTLAALFRGVTVSGLTFRAPRVIDAGSDGTYYQKNVLVDFYRDSTF